MSGSTSATESLLTVHHGADEAGTPLTAERFRAVLSEEMDCLRTPLGAERFDAGRFS